MDQARGAYLNRGPMVIATTQGRGGKKYKWSSSLRPFLGVQKEEDRGGPFWILIRHVCSLSSLSSGDLVLPYLLSLISPIPRNIARTRENVLPRWGGGSHLVHMYNWPWKMNGFYTPRCPLVRSWHCSRPPVGPRGWGKNLWSNFPVHFSTHTHVLRARLLFPRFTLGLGGLEPVRCHLPSNSSVCRQNLALMVGLCTA